MLFAFLSPGHARVVIIAAVVVGFAVYHWWRWRASSKSDSAPFDDAPQSFDSAPSAETLPEIAPSPKPAPDSTSIPVTQPAPAVTNSAPAQSPAPAPSPNTYDYLPTASSGEELFQRARAIVHQQIPDYRIDGLYLDLLGDSAALGYAPALKKLGEYAMRRETWVEAYYWMWRAKQKGVANLDLVLQEIRRNWTMNGSPREAENVYELFSEEASSIAFALISIDAGLDTYAAKEFLKTNHPEFLPDDRT